LARPRHAGPSGTACSRTVDHQPGSDSLGVCTQSFVGGVHQVGHHRKSCVRVVRKQPVEGFLIEHADLG
jgi:hypothetical protein